MCAFYPPSVAGVELLELPAGARIPLGIIDVLDRIEMARNQRVHADIGPDKAGVDMDGLGRNQSCSLALLHDTREDAPEQVFAPALTYARQRRVSKARASQKHRQRRLVGNCKINVAPTRNGRAWKEDCLAAHARNETLRATRYFGRAFWKRWTGYHAQSRVEAKMCCLKAFGERIAVRDRYRQTAEICIRIALMNRFSALGTAEIVRVA